MGKWVADLTIFKYDSFIKFPNVFKIRRSTSSVTNIIVFYSLLVLLGTV